MDPGVPGPRVSLSSAAADRPITGMRWLTHVDAASVPVVAVTALQMLFDQRIDRWRYSRAGAGWYRLCRNPDQERATRQGVTAKFILVDVRTEPLTRIAALLDAQQLTTNIGTLLPLADVRIAHEMLEGRRGKRRYHGGS